MKMAIDGISQGYGKENIISDISFEAESGELLTVLGPNGCGKSTLIKTLCGVMKPRTGSVSIDGTDLLSVPPDELAKK
ncbi:MAG: ATP-binding cassette domain-containing protein, partial [Candidatus Methanomethylophilaceae archaeon]|nr:ATP-binding cassette domain-containing protein [Candidatus Methanomethylophilaceae archaeon]